MTLPGGHVDPRALERSLEGLRRTVAGSAIEQALEKVLEAALVLFDVRGTGLMLIDGGRELRSVASTDAPGRVLEETQQRVGRGPCVDALMYDTVVQCRDLAQDERWPELSPEVPAAGVRAVLGVPVHVAGNAVGALNCYVDAPREWAPSEIRALQAFADLIGSVLASGVQAHERGEISRQLQHALDNRVLIERAIGMIMGRHGVDAVSAFNRLREVARSRRERVVELAERVLQGTPLERD